MVVSLVIAALCLQGAGLALVGYAHKVASDYDWAFPEAARVAHGAALVACFLALVLAFAAGGAWMTP